MADDDDGAAAPSEAFRAAMARLAAGVSVVAVPPAVPGRADAVAPVTSLVSVSLDPPMVLFCVHADARLRDALDGVDRWAVSILDASAGPVADWLASPGRPAVGALGVVPHTRSEVSGAVLIEQAQAWLECRTSWIRSAGDHDVVVGEVVTARVASGARGALVHWLARLEPFGG